MENKAPKYSPGCYLLNNVAVLEISIKDAATYSISLLYQTANVKLPLASSGTEISFKKFESIINTYGKELIPVDTTKAEILGLIYGTEAA